MEKLIIQGFKEQYLKKLDKLTIEYDALITYHQLRLYESKGSLEAVQKAISLLNEEK